MRLVASVVLSLVLLLGTYFYTSFAESVRAEPSEVQPALDDRTWSLKLDATSDLIYAPDDGAPSLLIRFNGSDLLSSERTITAGEVVELKNIEGVEVGLNSLFFEATLASLDDFSDSEMPRAIRVRLQRGATEFTERLYWIGAEEMTYSDSVFFEIGGSDAAQSDDSDKHSDDHDH